MPFVKSRGAEIYYEVHGEGPVLVFAHGMGGNHLSWWQQVPEFVGRGYRVVTFDHRGFGRSTCPPESFHPRRGDRRLPGSRPLDLLRGRRPLQPDRRRLPRQALFGIAGRPGSSGDKSWVAAIG